MPIDIHQLDKFEYDDSETEESWEKFQDALLHQFYDSPEGQARLKDDSGMGFWAAHLIEFGFTYAEPILHFLKQIDPEFNGLMNDSSKFGMAKSFFMLGQSRGFDMTSQKGLDEFMLEYNAKLIQQNEPPPLPSAEPAWLDSGSFVSGSIHHRKTNKNKRKMEKQSRKKNRKKK
ncbi:hypothetical protein L0244_40660 [bacterium]|nr:hypothetical protein [bacterium]